MLRSSIHENFLTAMEVGNCMRSIELKQASFRLAFELSAIIGAITIALVYIWGQTDNGHVFHFATQIGGIGNNIFLLATNGIIFVWAWRRKMPGVIGSTLVMDTGVWLVVQSIKLIPFGEWALRPNGVMGGFPSGHTTHAFAMAFTLTTLFPRQGWLWYICAAIIAWSRVEAVRHTPLQVTAGVFLGVAIGAIFIQFLLKKYAPVARAAESLS